MLPGSPRMPRRALASKDTNTPLERPKSRATSKPTLAPLAISNLGTVDQSAQDHTSRCAAAEVSAQPSSAVLGSSPGPTVPDTASHELETTTSSKSSPLTPSLDVGLDHDKSMASAGKADATPSSLLERRGGYPALSLGHPHDATSSSSEGGSSAPSTPPLTASSSPPSRLSAVEVPTTPSSEAATTWPGAHCTSPGVKPLSAFACATPVRVYTPASPPIVGTSRSPLRFAAEYSDHIHQAAVNALATMDPDDITALVESTAVVQGKWLDTVFFRARLDLTAAPIKLPEVVNAYEYTIPGSTQPLWVVTLRNSAVQHVQASNIFASPSSPGGAASTRRPKAVTRRTSLGRALVELKALPQLEQNALNANRERCRKWLAAAEQRHRTATPPPSTTPPAVDQAAALKLARLPPGARTPMEAVIKANQALSPAELAVVQVSPKASEAWRREVVRLWKVKFGWPTEIQSVVPTSQDKLAKEDYDHPLPTSIEPEHLTQSSSLATSSASPSENPFEAHSRNCKPSNPFAARLRGEGKASRVVHSHELLASRPREPGGRARRRETATETPTKVPISRHPLQSFKPRLTPPLQPAAHTARVPLGPAPSATLRPPSPVDRSYPKPPLRAFSHSHIARKHGVCLEIAVNRVRRRYNQPTTPQAWSEYVRRIEADRTQDAARDEAEIQRRFAAGRNRHEQWYTQHAAERGAHQWAHVASLADTTSACAKYVRLMEAYPKWVVGAGEACVNLSKGIIAPCQDCAGLAKDKEMLAWLKIEVKVGRLKPAVAASTELDITRLEDYLMEREAEQHECPEVLLDRLPEDAVTLLELRVFYGLGNTPTIPCLFWSCPAAYEAAAVKLVRLRMGVDLVNLAVDEALLKKVKNLTSILRKELYSLGAFVGWLPLNHGCEPSRQHAPVSSSLHPSKQYMSSEPLTEHKRSGPDWMTYQQTYKRLGPDAAFWYDRLERGIVMFDACYDPAKAPLDTTPRKLTPARKRKQHLVEGIEHLGAVYNLVSLPGPAWRTFPDEGRAVPPWPPEFAGSTLSVVAVRKREPNLAHSLSNALFEFAVRAQSW